MALLEWLGMDLGLDLPRRFLEWKLVIHEASYNMVDVYSC